MLRRICQSIARSIPRSEKYSRSIRRISESNRDINAPRSVHEREPGLSFISYARRIIVREQRGYKFPPFKFQIRFFPSNLGSARARITFGAPLPALIGPADRFGMECSTYFLSFARKNFPSCRIDLNNVAQFAP